MLRLLHQSVEHTARSSPSYHHANILYLSTCFDSWKFWKVPFRCKVGDGLGGLSLSSVREPAVYSAIRLGWPLPWRRASSSVGEPTRGGRVAARCTGERLGDEEGAVRAGEEWAEEGAGAVEGSLIVLRLGELASARSSVGAAGVDGRGGVVKQDLVLVVVSSV